MKHLLLGLSLILNTSLVHADEQTLILFDFSHSMTRPIPGQKTPKIKIAREALKKIFTETSTHKTALAAFGNGQSGDKQTDCEDFRIYKNFSITDDNEIKNQFKSIEPKGQQTPLAFALSKVKEELAETKKSTKIILISDGQETCKLDPVPIAEHLAKMGHIVDTIGIGQSGDFSQLGEIALAGTGSFKLADSTASLLEALQNASGQKLIGINTASSNTPTSALVTQKLVKVFPAQQEPNLSLPQHGRGQPKENALSLEIILDASGSMMGQIESKYKIDIAKEVLKSALGNFQSDLVEIGLRAYGFDTSVAKTAEASCPNTELVVPFAKNSFTEIIKTSQSLSAYGYTPLAKSLKKAGEDLKTRSSIKKNIVLISDGKETCGGDPIRELELLKAQGIDVQVHVIGFDIDKETREQLVSIAKAGNGTYFDAKNSEELVQTFYSVIHDAKKEAEEIAPDRIINPITGSSDIRQAPQIKPGTYTLDRHLEKNERVFFFVPAKKAQRIIVVGYSQAPRIIQDKDGNFKERSRVASTFKIEMFAPERLKRDKLKSTRAIQVAGKLGSQSITHYVDLYEEGVYFSISAYLERLNKDALFKVQIQEAGDVTIQKDSSIEDPLEITSEVAHISHLGLEDREDTFEIDVNGLESIKLLIQFDDEIKSRRAGIKPKVEEFRFKVNILNPKTNRRIERFLNKRTLLTESIEIPEALEALIIQIEDSNPALYNMFSHYSITIREDQ